MLVYDLLHSGIRLSVSLMTLEFRAEGAKTRLVQIEQGCYLTGGTDAVKCREHGTTWQVDNLVALIEGRASREFS